MKHTSSTLLTTLFVALAATAALAVKNKANDPKRVEVAQEPKRLMIQLKISETDAAGKETVISRPTIDIAEGKEGAISWGEKDGKGMKINVIASRVIEGKQE